MRDFTPGPWVFESQRGSKQEHCFWGVLQKTEQAYRGEVCSISDAAHIGGITEEEALANARLIAAAPELLEALQIMVKQFTKTPSTLADTEARGKAHAAIAKATGGQS